jgi:putative restriction endonuclease
MDFDTTNFDMPVFKVLARNDTGAARGHQAGLVIPRAITQYFPLISDDVSPLQPTVEEFIFAELYLEANLIATVETRYQLQTWGGTRPPEYRLTNGLSPLRKRASAGDVLTIQRSVFDPKLYRLTLIKDGSPRFQRISREFRDRRWGPLFIENEPLMELTADLELRRQEALLNEPFSMFEPDPLILDRRVISISRSRAFSTLVMRAYNNTCAVCGHALTLPSGRSEVEAGHIVPRSRSGSDDVRNGLALCRSHHWAFDSGLFSVSPQREIHVPAASLRIRANAQLAQYQQKPINLPKQIHTFPASEALEWHFENIMLRD